MHRYQNRMRVGVATYPCFAFLCAPTSTFALTFPLVCANMEARTSDRRKRQWNRLPDSRSGWPGRIPRAAYRTTVALSSSRNSATFSGFTNGSIRDKSKKEDLCGLTSSTTASGSGPVFPTTQPCRSLAPPSVEKGMNWSSELVLFGGTTKTVVEGNLAGERLREQNLQNLSQLHHAMPRMVVVIWWNRIDCGHIRHSAIAETRLRQARKQPRGRSHL